MKEERTVTAVRYRLEYPKYQQGCHTRIVMQDGQIVYYDTLKDAKQARLVYLQKFKPRFVLIVDSRGVLIE